MRKRTIVQVLVASLLCVLGGTIAKAALPFCEDSLAPQCGGICPPGSSCQDLSQLPSGATTSGDLGCACFPDLVPLSDCGVAPQCGGECEIGTCLPASEVFGLGFARAQSEQDEPCLCAATFCGVAPQCGGECGEGEQCIPPFFGENAVRDLKDPGATAQGIELAPCVCAPRGEPGGCCLPDASCQQLHQYDCLAAGGAFAGEGEMCAPDLCRGSTVYEDSECANPFEDISGTGTALLLGDDQGQTVPLGFSFDFYTSTHTTVGISSNGFVGFNGSLTTYQNVPIPDSAPPNNFVAPFWTDLDPGDGGTIHYQTLGAAPNRRFVVQWTAVPEFDVGGANTFQVVLYEGTNTVEFHYGPLSAPAGTIGVENVSGLVGTAVPRASIAQGDCILLTPANVASAPAEAPALGERSTALLVIVLLSVALWAMRRAMAPRRG